MFSSLLARLRLRSGEKAIRQGRWDRAEAQLLAAFRPLHQRCLRDRRALAELQRALLGLVGIYQQRGTPEAAVEYCRLARAVGVEHQAALDVPCQAALAGGDLSPGAVADLVQWACRRLTSPGDIPASDVMRALATSLHPRANLIDPQARKSHLHTLASASLPWSWVAHYRAEDARLAGDWATAAEELDVAARLATDPRRQADLRWRKLHCLLLISRAQAEDEFALLADCPPTGATQWRLALQIIAEGAPVAGGVALADKAITEHPHDEEIWFLAQAIAHRDHQWEKLAQWAQARNTPDRPAAQRIANLRLRCEMAWRKRDVELARACVEQVAAIGPTRRELPDEVREFAALVIAAAGPWNEDLMSRLVRSAASPAALSRFYVATVWQTCEGRRCVWTKQLAADVKQITAPIRHGRHWAELVWLSNCHLLVRQTKPVPLAGWLTKGLAQHASLPTAQRRWLLASAVGMAAETSDEKCLLACANAADDSLVRRWAGEQIRRRALTHWREQSPSQVDELTVVITRLRDAAALGAPLTDIELTLLHALSLAAGQTRPDSDDGCPLPTEVPAGPPGFAAAWLAIHWARRTPNWWRPAVEIVNGQTDPLSSWLAKATATELARGGDLPAAARMLGIQDASPAAILASLGLPAGDVHSARAWGAYQQREFDECVRHCLAELRAGQNSNGRALALAVRALDAGDLLGGEANGHVAEISQALRAASQNGHRPQLPWFVWARLGLLEQTAAVLGERIQQAPATAAALQAYALVQLALAEQMLRGADDDGARRHLACALGAWAALLETHHPALSHFAIDRFRRYGHGHEVPGPRQTVRLADETIHRIVGRFGASAGGDARRPRLMWELEKAAAAVVARHGGLPTAGGAIVAGPMLATALDIERAHEQIAARLEGQSQSSQSHLDGLQLLAALLGHELGDLAGFSTGQTTAKDVLELRRLFSPLGPAHVLMDQERYGDARAELEALGDSASPNNAHDAWTAMLWRHVDPQQAGPWLQSQRHQMLIECDLQGSRQLVGRVPIDFEETRRTWERALVLGAAIGQRDDVRDCIGEIAVGRGRTLFEKRSKQQRLADELDRRGNAQRQEESIQLLEMAWSLTSSTKVEGPAYEHLNYMGVIAWEKKQQEQALQYFLRALAVKPNSSRAAKNYQVCVLTRLHDTFDADRDEAGEQYLLDRQGLAAIDPYGQSTEIQECLVDTDANAAYRYFQGSSDALDKEDFSEAAALMVWALRIFGGNPNVQDSARHLAGRLREKADAGDAVSQRLLETLRAHYPPGFQETLSLEDELHRLLRATPQGRALELNAEAVRLAEQERFAESMQLLAEANQLAPGMDMVRENVRAISVAWASRAIARGDFPESMQALELAHNILGPM